MGTHSHCACVHADSELTRTLERGGVGRLCLRGAASGDAEVAWVGRCHDQDASEGIRVKNEL